MGEKGEREKDSGREGGRERRKREAGRMGEREWERPGGRRGRQRGGRNETEEGSVERGSIGGQGSIIDTMYYYILSCIMYNAMLNTSFAL